MHQHPQFKESEMLPNVKSRSKSINCGEIVSRTCTLGVSNTEFAELISASAIGMIAFPAKSETKVEPNRIQHWNWLCSHSPASVLTEFKSAAVKLTVMVSLFSREKMTFVSVYKVSDLGILWSLIQ